MFYMKLLYVGLKSWFEGTIGVWKKELYSARQITCARCIATAQELLKSHSICNPYIFSTTKSRQLFPIPWHEKKLHEEGISFLEFKTQLFFKAVSYLCRLLNGGRSTRFLYSLPVRDVQQHYDFVRIIVTKYFPWQNPKTSSKENFWEKSNFPL